MDDPVWHTLGLSFVVWACNIIYYSPVTEVSDCGNIVTNTGDEALKHSDNLLTNLGNHTYLEEKTQT